MTVRVTVKTHGLAARVSINSIDVGTVSHHTQQTFDIGTDETLTVAELSGEVEQPSQDQTQDETAPVADPEPADEEDTSKSKRGKRELV